MISDIDTSSILGMLFRCSDSVFSSSLVDGVGSGGETRCLMTPSRTHARDLLPIVPRPAVSRRVGLGVIREAEMFSY